MKKSTLLTIKDILLSVDNANRNLYEMLDLLNITPEERATIEDAIMVTAEKIEQIRRSQINELNQHMDVDYIERIFNY
jgi:hypothetical protein